MSLLPLSFRAQDCPATLREGIAELRSALSEGERHDAAMNRDFFAHDACHVLFGQGTSVAEDAVVDVWITLGTDVGARAYWSALLRSRALGDLVARQGWLGVAGGVARALPRCLVAALRARAMRRKWPWTGAEAHLDRPLAEIRREFGIRVQ